MRYDSDFDSPQGIRRYIKYIMARLEKNEMTERKAQTLNKLAYTILATLQEERKALEVDKLEQLKEQLKKMGG